MSAFADRVKDTTTTTGTGNITLAGSAPTGFQTFAAAFAVGMTRIPYAIVGQTGGEWETGHGTLSGSTTLVRERVFESSNSDALVNFSSGTKDVFVTSPGLILADFVIRGRVEMVRLGAVTL